MSDKKNTIVELWPILKDDVTKFISDRPGWLINALEKTRDKKGLRGWNDVETVINILRFLKDTEVEY